MGTALVELFRPGVELGIRRDQKSAEPVTFK